jgi:hypothetical protein
MTTVLAAAALANKATPPSGTAIKLKVGEKFVIKVGGTQNCKFDVMTNSDNSKVASVSSTSVQKSSHSIEVMGVSPGATNVTLLTANGSIPQCQGFQFSYPVTVEPDIDGFAKQAKKKLADATKNAKNQFASDLKDFCDLLMAILASAKSNDITVEAALDDALELANLAVALIHSDADSAVNEILDGLDVRAVEEFGITFVDELPLSVLPGGCGDFDKFESATHAAAQKALDMLLKKMKKFAKDLSAVDKAKGGGGVTILVPPPHLLYSGESEVIGFGNPPPPPNPPKNLKKTWHASGRLSDNPTGQMSMGGTADPGAGDVTITITKPGGGTEQTTSPVDNKCRWKAKFTNLPPGTYTAAITQGANGPVNTTIIIG